MFRNIILTHGGAGSDPCMADGTLAAAAKGMDVLRAGETALTAVVEAVRHLEDDARFNAGTGSTPRDDGSVQLDASCMTGDGLFGAVACIEGIANPVDVAREVLLRSAHILLVGEGAEAFARKADLPRAIFRRPAPSSRTHTPSCDTVGAVAFDGHTFAAALSTGGIRHAMRGRVGDVPLPGCGLFCGPAGAVACTGHGETISRKLLAREVYVLLASGTSPEDAARRALSLFEQDTAIGLLILTDRAFAARASRQMAWSQLGE